MKKKRIGRIVSIFFILFIMILLLLHPDIYGASVTNGLHLYIDCVLPSVLPFFFLSKLLTELDFASDLSEYFGKPLSFLYRVPACSAYILLMSLLCGYPVGAKLISEFRRAGALTDREAKTVMAFTSNSGPVFIIGTVGIAMFQNRLYGFIILSSHYLGSLINGFIYRNKTFLYSSYPLTGWAGGDILNKSMYNTLLSVGQVGGYIILFNVLCDIVANTFLFLIPSPFPKAFLLGLLEVTRGCCLLAELSVPTLYLLPACTFLITFGGMSICLQSLSFLSRIKISPAYFFITKITQGILSAFLCFLLCLVFGF